MRLRLILVSFLLLPGVALGPGWCLRYCTAQLFGDRSCCAEVTEQSCCPSDQVPTDSPATDDGPRDGCDACCLDIDTSPEHAARAPVALEHELKRAELAIRTVCLAAPAPRVPARTSPAWSRPPPSSAGPVAPLPLRI